MSWKIPVTTTSSWSKKFSKYIQSATINSDLLPLPGESWHNGIVIAAGYTFTNEKCAITLNPGDSRVYQVVLEDGPTITHWHRCSTLREALVKYECLVGVSNAA